MNGEKSKDIHELTLRVNSLDKEMILRIRASLYFLGISDEKISELQKDGKTYVSIYDYSKKRITSLEKKIKSLKFLNVSLLIESLEEKKWKESWKDSLRPFKLTNNYTVVPIWLKEKNSLAEEKTIFIDTKLAFGTGLHETTQFMSQFIERMKNHFDSFLDIGTGTGILTILALKYGATNTRSLDIDPPSIHMAEENLSNNGFLNCDLRILDIGSCKIRKKYDFVAANLITHDLIKFKKKILSFVKMHKYLAVSGISLENLNFFSKAFSSSSLRCLKIKKGKTWAALLYKRV